MFRGEPGRRKLLKVHGINVPITSDEVSPIIWQALTSGSYEAKEARSIFKAVKPGDRVLELGSGIGIITAIIAKIADVSVWAFEANPSTAALARRVVDANGLENVVLSQGILTAGEPCSFRFYVRRDLWMSSMDLTGVERIFLELHDHLYGLAGIRDMTHALAAKGYAYDPRGSQGPCVLFSKDDGAREYEPE